MPDESEHPANADAAPSVADNTNNVDDLAQPKTSKTSVVDAQARRE